MLNLREWYGMIVETFGQRAVDVLSGVAGTLGALIVLKVAIWLLTLGG